MRFVCPSSPYMVFSFHITLLKQNDVLFDSFWQYHKIFYDIKMFFYVFYSSLLIVWLPASFFPGFSLPPGSFHSSRESVWKTLSSLFLPAILFPIMLCSVIQRPQFPRVHCLDSRVWLNKWHNHCLRRILTSRQFNEIKINLFNKQG